MTEKGIFGALLLLFWTYVSAVGKILDSASFSFKLAVSCRDYTFVGSYLDAQLHEKCTQNDFTVSPRMVLLKIRFLSSLAL